MCRAPFVSLACTPTLRLGGAAARAVPVDRPAEPGEGGADAARVERDNTQGQKRHVETRPGVESGRSLGGGEILAFFFRSTLLPVFVSALIGSGTVGCSSRELVDVYGDLFRVHLDGGNFAV